MPLLALLPYALSLVPELLTVFAGDKTGKLAEQAAEMVRTATGTTDPAAAQTAMAGNREAQTQLRIQLASIIAQQEAAKDAARNEAMRIAIQGEVARLGDVQNARARDVSLKEKGVRNVRADVMVALVLVGLGGILLMLWFGNFTQGGSVEGFILTAGGVFLGCFKDAFQFEFGSSRGSADKAAAMERLATTAQGSQGAAVTTTGDVATTGNVTVQSGAGTPTIAPRPDATADELTDIWNPTVPRKPAP